MAPMSDLAQRLADPSSLILPEHPTFQRQAARWREWHGPSLSAIARPTTEADVQEIVRFANEHGIPFVARSGGHGATEALLDVEDGIQIDLRGMNSVEVSADGMSARVGGGTNVKDLVNGLEKAGKRTVTGICELVGVSAVMLGGGHGWLQGQHGLPVDQVLSARLVVPSGDVVEASPESNPDLFWAIKGAGHNFGIVTEWNLRTYDLKDTKWSYEVFVFSGEKLEPLYTLTNEMMKTQPPELTHWTYIISPAEIKPEHPLIWYAIVYDGPVDKAREYTRPIHDIGPMMVNAGVADTHELAEITFQGENSPGCAYGLTSVRYPIGLKSYNIDALRKVYDDIDETFKRVPELSGSFFLLEGYSSQGVRAIDEETSVFPHRDDNLLVTSYIQYKPDSKIDPLAQEFGLRLRNYLLAGSDDPAHLRAYVNYAHGTESLSEVYGWNEERLTRLKSLKAEWDPENKMRFYMPIS
ncbi:FAD-binding domain-containing protein [Xylariaceae sp. FL1019]|nr:FAD-binding domain-containing protein [Xylariaceae sp. FL1019]